MNRTSWHLAAALFFGGSISGCASSQSSWPPAQQPTLVQLRAGPPVATFQANSNGQYEAMPITAAMIKVAAPWPATLTIAVNGIDMPKDESSGHPGCTGTCIGYYKVENIDAQPAMPVWDLYVHPSSTAGAASTLTIDIRSKSSGSSYTGTQALSAPLSLVLVTPPVAPPTPPPPQTAESHVSFREGVGSGPLTCSYELRWEWKPGANVSTGGISTAFKIPANQPFKTYAGAHREITDASGNKMWYCVYNDQAPGPLSLGDWTIELYRTSGQIASCAVTLAAGHNWTGFRLGSTTCKLTLTSHSFSSFTYPP